MKIKYYNRQTDQIENEIVYGDLAIKWLYESQMGSLCSKALTGAFVSKLYGAFQNLPLSSRRLDNFVKNFKIELDDYLPEKEGVGQLPYSSFNNFFIRKFRPEKRSFIKEESRMPAFVEGRYFGHKEHNLETKIPVKGIYLNPIDLLGGNSYSKFFGGGPLLIARLCPVDYHRFHFPDDGKILEQYKIKGQFHSVNPIALKKKEDIFITNERNVAILETKNFGKLAYVEVGAMCVGKIVQTHKSKTFQRGEEKGYFLFGGSTVILLGEKGKWSPSLDVLEKTQNGIETFIQLGNEVGI